MSIVDAHVHVWDATAFSLPWLEDAPALPRTALPGQIDRAGGQSTQMVFVEADRLPAQAIAEARWVDGLDWPELGAIVAHADLRSGDALTEHLDELGTIGRVRGIRHLLQSDDVDAWEPESFTEGLREVGARGLRFDACVQAGQLPALASLLAQAPQTATVLDHLGKPPVDAGVDSAPGRAWAAGLRQVAALPHTSVKLSGLAAESQDASAYAKNAAAFIAVALEAFGADRAMIGSDWPVSSRRGAATSTGDWIATVHAAARVGDAEWQRIRAGTARRFYRMD